MALDLSDGGKHVRTRDGRLVKILMTDGGSSQPVIGVVLNGEVWCPHRWSPDGSFYNPAHTHGCDLIPYTPTETWLIECPAGQTPIVFVPTGEVRKPNEGELYSPDDTQVYMRGNSHYSMGKPILARVQPRKAT